MSRDNAFRQASIPADLAREAARITREHPELGYRTVSEFVRTATIAQMRHVHTQLALNALWATAELGADAVHALLRDSLPSDYLAVLEESKEARRRTFG